MFPSYCPQENPYKKHNEKFAVKTEMRDYQSISIGKTYILPHSTQTINQQYKLFNIYTV